MKLKTFALSSLALACMSATPAYAEDDWVNVYGKIMLTLDKKDFEADGEDQWEVNSNASRFGIKGKGKAGNLEAFYKLEWEVDVADSSKSSDDHIKARNQIVGLRGGFGEVFAGRHDTPTKKLQKKVDLFNDLHGDIKRTFNGEVRASNIVQYTTPKMGDGFKAKIAFVPGEDSANNIDGLADGTSVAFEYKTGDLNLGLSLDSDIEGVDVSTTRAVAQYKISDWQLGFLYQDTENADGVSRDGMMVSAKYKMDDSTVKIQIAETDIFETEVGKAEYSSQVSLGWDKKLGKKTTFFTYYTTGEVANTNTDDSIFGIGVIQKF